MKVSVIISTTDNRESLFNRSLYTWSKQTLPKSEWELIVIDDGVRKDVRNQCLEAATKYKMNINFIRIDKNKSFYKVKSFIPALTNNIGFRQAKGDVIVITGPETLQKNTNLEISTNMINRNECAYGLVFKANIPAVDEFTNKWKELKNQSIEVLLQIPGAQNECPTKPPNPPRYWYYMTVAKKYVEEINGVDECFVGGLCGEDDDFSFRIGKSGIKPVFDYSIIGIHQDHTREDSNDLIHESRFSPNGKILRQNNFKLLKQNLRNKNYKVNLNHQWGDENLIILNENYSYGDNK